MTLNKEIKKEIIKKLIIKKLVAVRGEQGFPESLCVATGQGISF
jgi:hypothetical protein